MKTFFLILLVLGITTFLIFIWVLCRACTLADRQEESD